MRELILPKAWNTKAHTLRNQVDPVTPDFVRHVLKTSLKAATKTESDLVNIENKGGPAADAEKDKSLLVALDYSTWLPFCAKEYQISPRIEDYILVSVPICPSDIPNRNGIGFPLTELVKYQPPPISRMAYKAWKGCPVHLEHDNRDHTKAHGVVLDASLHKITGYGGGKLWKVMGLLAIDKNKYPEVAQKVLVGEIDTYSMGALVDYFSCSYCGAKYSEQGHCSHVTGPDTVNWKTINDMFTEEPHIAYLNAHVIQPIEVSIVKDPAWAPALSDTLLSY